MKISRKHLRSLIEASIIKKGNYTIPVEAPLEDPRDFDFDLSDENKEKLFGLAAGDDSSQAQADSVADALDFPSSGRFGADTLSKQTKMYDMGLDIINDPEIDQLLDRAIELYFNDYGHYLADDLTHTLMQGYKYPEGPGGFQLFLKGDPNFDAKKLNIDADYFHGDRPALDIDMINSVMEKMSMLIGVKLMNLSYYIPNQSINISLVSDYIDPETLKLAKQLSPQALNQLMAKLRKAAELFKRRTAADRIPAVTQHVYDKMMKPMYEIFTKAHQEFNPNQDMSQIKEGKIKITRRQLRRLIEASIIKKGDYTIPVEDPLPDPLKDLDYTEDQKAKLKTLALSSDQDTRVQSNFLADVGDYQSIDRFGVDTFSKHVQGDDLGINMLNDLDVDSAISKACDYWIYDHKDELSYSGNIDHDTFNEYADYILDGYGVDQVLSEIKMYTTEVLDKRIKSFIKISNSASAVPPVDEKIAKLENALKLFSSSHLNVVVGDHLMLKFKSALYPFYLDWKKYYMSGERDIPEEELTPELKAKFANIKEGRE